MNKPNIYNIKSENRLRVDTAFVVVVVDVVVVVVVLFGMCNCFLMLLPVKILAFLSTVCGNIAFTLK